MRNKLIIHATRAEVSQSIAVMGCQHECRRVSDGSNFGAQGEGPILSRAGFLTRQEH